MHKARNQFWLVAEERWDVKSGVLEPDPVPYLSSSLYDTHLCRSGEVGNLLFLSGETHWSIEKRVWALSDLYGVRKAECKGNGEVERPNEGGLQPWEGGVMTAIVFGLWKDRDGGVGDSGRKHWSWCYWIASWPRRSPWRWLILILEAWADASPISKLVFWGGGVGQKEQEVVADWDAARDPIKLLLRIGLSLN